MHNYDESLEHDREAIEGFYERENRSPETPVYIVFIESERGGCIIDYSDSNEAFALNALQRAVDWCKTPYGKGCKAILGVCELHKYHKGLRPEQILIIKNE